MFCSKCGKEITDGQSCPYCSEVVEPVIDGDKPLISENNQKYIPESDEDYRIIAKRLAICFLIPFLFFIPLTKKYSKLPGSIDVANNSFYIFAMSVIFSTLASCFNSLLFTAFYSILCVFAIVMFVCALTGHGIKVPFFEKIKVFK